MGGGLVIKFLARVVCVFLGSYSSVGYVVSWHYRVLLYLAGTKQIKPFMKVFIKFEHFILIGV